MIVNRVFGTRSNRTNPGLEIVADPYVGSTMGSAYHAMSSLLDKEPAVDAIFSVNGNNNAGHLASIKKQGAPGKNQIYRL